ncbi:LysE/ArgO family amino acid transporter [Neptunicella sp. SCSIO 80796]|uniref:LysE/ArgO family amino acid transporter n=1 Tax=Neptunicella plasticusilytica TaxID=3117012 RepID=UPI003A4DEEE5
MLAALFQGFVLGLSMILPIGAQNSLVLNQGILRSHHLTVASVCALCDALLISAGLFGAGTLINRSPLALSVITCLGVAFLLFYGAQSLKSALAIKTNNAVQTAKKQGFWAVIATTLAVTLLNPHVYLDTVVVIGGVGSQFSHKLLYGFAIGCIGASVVWFFALAIAAAKLSPLLAKPRVKQAIDFLIFVMMWMIAAKLLIFWISQ